MKCMSCEAEINPKWKHAVDSNLCPFCGATIMDVELKKLLSTLSSTIDKLSAHPDYLEDWLRTHGYVHEDKIVKIEAPLTVLPKQPLDKNTVAIQDQSVTNKFFKNADADKIAGKTQHLKEMASQIKRAGGTSNKFNISPDDIDTSNPEVVADLQEILGADLQEVLGSSQEIASSLPQTGGDEDEIHPIALAMAQMAGGKGGQSNAKDLIKLQQLQNKTASARNRMLSGSSGKGSFSRG